jgi:hypothetical protein
MSGLLAAAASDSLEHSNAISLRTEHAGSEGNFRALFDFEQLF